MGHAAVHSRWPDEAWCPPPKVDTAVLTDLQHAMGPLRLLSLRAAVAELDTLHLTLGWSLQHAGEPPEPVRDEPLERAFPGAVAAVSRLHAAPGGSTVQQRLSPRRWMLAWRLDRERVAVAVVHYTDGRASLPDDAVATVRLLCGAGLLAEQAVLHAQVAPAAAGGPAWPVVERRRRALPPWRAWPSLLLVCASALMVAWLAVVWMPQARQHWHTQQARVDQLQALADSSFSRDVASALGTGDYAEVQATLAQFAARGYLEHAVVVNARQQVVALVGEGQGARVGETLPAGLGPQGRAVDLRLGAEPFGRLYYQRAGLATPPDPALGAMQALAALALASAAMASGLIASRRPRARAAAD
jgi:hypothetical protein